MQFTISVVESKETKGKKNNRGGEFAAVDLVYKREGKVEAKSFPDWANKEIYQTLLDLKSGDVRLVSTEKVGEFWKWLSIIESSGSGEQVGPETSGSAAPSTSYPTKAYSKSSGGNYETSEERARRQVMIVRQSSISSAVAMLPDVRFASDIVEAAKVFEAYVLS